MCLSQGILRLWIKSKPWLLHFNEEKPLYRHRPSASCCRDALTWLAVAPAAVGDSAPMGRRKRGGLSTGEFRRR